MKARYNGKIYEVAAENCGSVLLRGNGEEFIILADKVQVVEERKAKAKDEDEEE